MNQELFDELGDYAGELAFLTSIKIADGKAVLTADLVKIDDEYGAPAADVVSVEPLTLRVDSSHHRISDLIEDTDLIVANLIADQFGDGASVANEADYRIHQATSKTGAAICAEHRIANWRHAAEGKE